MDSTTDASINKDQKYHQHIAQIRRAKELLTKTVNARNTASRMSILLWYLCNFFAVCGFLAGASITTSNLTHTPVDIYLNTLLGLIVTVYPISRYLDLEGKRHRFNSLSLFCTDLEIQLNESCTIMEDAMKNLNSAAFDVEKHNGIFEKMMKFINETSKNIEKLSIGAEEFQQVLKNYQSLENNLKNA